MFLEIRRCVLRKEEERCLKAVNLPGFLSLVKSHSTLCIPVNS